MIRVTRLDRREIALNSDLIETVETRPDTTIKLVTGQSLVVRETLDEVVERVRAWRASLAEHGAAAMLRAPLTPALLPPAAPDQEPPVIRAEPPATELVEVPA